MSASILVPSALQAYTQGRDEIAVEAATVAEALAALTELYPAIKPHLFTDDGRLRSFVNIYVGDRDIRHLDGLNTALSPGDEMMIVPSIAGGTGTLDPTAKASEHLSAEELLRYSRHLILPEVALEGQKKLKGARVLCVGAGGLGSPLAMYLAAAGVGTLGIVDFDVVDASNLHRQIIHSTLDIGKPKLQSARETLSALNPNVRIEEFPTALTSHNALEIVREFDVVVDGTDNFPTRYLVNDACVLLGKPNVYGAIFRFEGQASVFWTQRGPCYRCLYPEPPPPGLVPSCAEGGVLGILPGLVGVIQATETIKLILGIGEPLIGRLLMVNTLKMQWRELKLKRDPGCPICGDQPTIRELIDYEAFCGMNRPTPDAKAQDDVLEISCTELKERLDRGDPIVVVDVREPYEAEIARIPCARLIPLADLPERCSELDPGAEIVLHCRSGVRSLKALRLLQSRGFSRLKNLKGGILAWADEVDPSLPKY
ncbi:MAG: molybdopterin-synthase adenylyltransferase MoeB [Chthonomonadales bacterium]